MTGRRLMLPWTNNKGFHELTDVTLGIGLARIVQIMGAGTYHYAVWGMYDGIALTLNDAKSQCEHVLMDKGWKFIDDKLLVLL